MFAVPLQDLHVIYGQLAGLEALSKLRDSALRSLGSIVRYDRRPANTMLYRYVNSYTQYGL